jgi:hypothetical protein
MGAVDKLLTTGNGKIVIFLEVVAGPRNSA